MKCKHTKREMRFVGGNMKMSKQANVVLFVMLSALSILPGCGKKNSDPAPVLGGPIVQPIGVPAYPGGPIVQPGGVGGGCIGIGYNSAITITFSGNLTQQYGYGSTPSGLVGQLGAYSVGAQTGGFASNFTRSNAAGDTLNVYVSGSQAYAVVTYNVNTINAIVAGGNNQICGLDMNVSIFNPAQSGSGWTGTLGGGVLKMWANQRWITYYNSTQLILL
jgi:hypothetical protein